MRLSTQCRHFVGRKPSNRRAVGKYDTYEVREVAFAYLIQGFSVDGNGAAQRRLKSRQRTQQRRFPGSVGPEQARKFPAIQGNIEPSLYADVARLSRAVTDVEALSRYGGGASHPLK